MSYEKMDWFTKIFLFSLICRTSGRKGITTRVTATQSSTYSMNINGNYFSYDAAKAIDGNNNQNFNDGSCSHTGVGQYTAWWQLDLGHSYEVNRVVIYYRNDTAKRLKGFKIYVSNNHKRNGTNHYRTMKQNLCYKDKSNGNLSVFQNISCIKTMKGRYVTIYNKRKKPNAFLELCEVDVYGCQVGRYGQFCQHVCNGNCRNKECNSTTGKCKECHRRFGFNCSHQCSDKCQGRKCIQDSGRCNSCLTGYYGFNCSHHCSNKCQGRKCIQDSGRCNSCLNEYYGFNCNKQCSGCLYGLCHQDTGVCLHQTECRKGYYGTHESEVMCNNSCYLNCNTCDKRNGTCKGCLAKRISLSCELPCSDQCSNSGCDSFSGECKGCKKGSYGPQCQYKCNDNCLHKTCNQSTGKCNQCHLRFGFNCSHSCSDKCHGKQCEQDSGKCKSCMWGYHGLTCSHSCSDKCHGEQCDQDSGKCNSCMRGYHGLNCSHPCSDKCQGNQCDQDSGKCNSCITGFYGFNCTKQCSGCLNDFCYQDKGVCNNQSGCRQGYYGTRGSELVCNHRCYRNCKTCDKSNGTCKVCNDGFYGHSCETNCPSNCINNVCTKENGTCKNGCLRTFYGDHCTNNCSESCKLQDCFRNGTCRVCNDGFYGQSCETNCPSNCINNVCTKENGSCKNGCQKTFYGDRCNNNCSESCKFQDCFQNGTCRDCVPGTYGNFCEQNCKEGCKNANCSRGGNCYDDCVKGYYGETCDKICSENCSAEGCNKHSSYCKECKIGLYGLLCSEQCSSRCNRNTCNKTTGICITCVKGHYGPYCNDTCSIGCKDELCVQMTGNCSLGCKDGFLGEYCQEKCKDYSYGENCMYTCGHCLKNNTCHFINGTCLKGCEDNWIGDKCDKEMLQLLADTNPVPVIAGSAVAVSTIIIAIVAGIVVFVYKRKKSRTSTDRAIELNTQGNKTGEESSLKKTFEEPKSLNRNKEDCANSGTKSVNLYDNTITIGKSKCKATNAREATKNDENAVVVYSNIEITCLDVVNLEKEIVKKKAESTFDLEYNKFQRDAVFPCTIASLPENKLLNRYLTTFPYDHSRVVLTDSFGSDYINASYIDGVTDSKSYIATQGPKKNTITDFWRMVWQVKSGKIVMLTNLVENIKLKCEQYWPDSSQSIRVGRLIVTLTHEKEFAFYVSRTFEVMDRETTECRTVEQLHFTSWPDHGVPNQTELVMFHRRFLSKETNQPGPPVVHCSAGIGRTGTFIALNALYLHGLTTGKVDVFNYVMSMRNNRMNMVQTKDQYVLLHDALVEQFKYDKTAISTHLFINFWNREKNLPLGKRKTNEEFKMLQFTKPKYCPKEFQSGNNKENKNKNRKENILPVEKYRIYLMSVDSSHTNYINAVMLQSVTKRYGYIATHYPLQNTVCDFWCMMYDQESEVIVALNGQGIDGTTWYPNTNDVLNCGRFAITQTSQSTVIKDVRETHFKLANKEANEERVGKLFELMCWPSKTTVPTCRSNLLHLLKLTEQLHSDGPITVVCQDGASCCGVFCALSDILQSQMLYEEVNIFTTISQLQKRRPEFIKSYEQYQFCHEVVEESLESASIYYNV